MSLPTKAGVKMLLSVWKFNSRIVGESTGRGKVGRQTSSRQKYPSGKSHHNHTTLQQHGRMTTMNAKVSTSPFFPVSYHRKMLNYKKLACIRVALGLIDAVAFGTRQQGGGENFICIYKPPAGVWNFKSGRTKAISLGSINGTTHPRQDE